MNVALAKEHRDFFRKQGLLELEALLTPQELDRLDAEIQAALAARLNSTVERLHLVPVEQRFSAGRDLWRSHPLLKKIVFAPKLGMLAKELFDSRALRYGCDFLLIGTERSVDAATPFGKLLKEKTSLSELIALQGVVGGLVISLDSGSLSPFPKASGNGVYLKADTEFDFSALQTGSALLIVYTGLSSVYIAKERDPHAYYLKSLQFNIGDRLGNVTHPLVA